MFTCILEPQTRIFMVQVQRAAQSNCRHQRERLLMMKLCAIFNCCVSAPNEDRVGKTARSEELRDVREMASKSQEMDNRKTEEDKGSKSLEMATPEPVSVHHADVAKPAEKANVSTEPLRKEAPLDVFCLPLPWYRYQTRTSVKAQLVLQADKRVRLTTEVRHKLEEDRREMLIMWFIRRRAAVKRASADAKYLAAQAAEDEVEEERRRVLRGCLKRRVTVREVANRKDDGVTPSALIADTWGASADNTS